MQSSGSTRADRCCSFSVSVGRGWTRASRTPRNLVPPGQTIGQTGRCGGAAPTQSPRAMLDRYCVTCHSDRLKTAGPTLESIDTTNIAAAPDVWEKVVRKVRVGMMPPQDRPPG